MCLCFLIYLQSRAEPECEPFMPVNTAVFQECPICYEKAILMVQCTQCQNRICFQCNTQIIRATGWKCPMCRHKRCSQSDDDEHSENGLSWYYRHLYYQIHH